MKKLIFAIILIVALVAGIIFTTNKISINKKQHKKTLNKIEVINKLPVKLKNLEGLECKAYKIPEKTAKYLKNKSEFSSVYKNKKFVVYIKDNDLPFAKEYSEKLEQISNDNKYKKYYNFVSRKAQIKITVMRAKDIKFMKKNNKKIPSDIMSIADGNAKLDFIKTCGNFCIVNPEKNQLISLKGGSKKESEKFEYILDKFKNW